MVLGQISTYQGSLKDDMPYRPFVGSIDELALYDRALTPGKFQRRASLINR